MTDFLKIVVIILGFILLFAFCLGITFALAYGAYWLTLWADAPKYVAVIVGIAVFVLSGVTAKINSHSK